MQHPLLFLGLGAESWLAVSTGALAVLTFILVVVGWFQIREARKQNQRWRTLEVCDQYHLNLSLGISLRRLRRAINNNTLQGNERDYRVDATRVLNYLDGMAIAISQGLYIEELARDHMQAIVKAHVKRYLTDEAAKKFEIDPENFRYLKALDDRWRAISRPHFVEGSRWTLSNWRRRTR